MLKTINKQAFFYIREKYRKIVFLRTHFFRDFIFIHINKTGGTSIEKALKLPLTHLTAIEYKNRIGEARWRKKFSFAIVRNPWDKVVSQYRYRVMIDETQLKKKTVSFNDWVKLVFVDNDLEYHNEAKMFTPQMDWLINEEGEIIVNFIGRFENFNEDWENICVQLNRKGLELPHVKKSVRTDYREYYNDHSIEIVAKWYRKDIEEFGYTFSGSPK